MYEVTKTQLTASVCTESRWCEVVQDAVMELESRLGRAESDTLGISLCFQVPERVDTKRAALLSMSFSSLKIKFPVFTKSGMYYMAQHK